ncbi:MAG: arylsulfatase [Verrucomicrobia bacterium]|nr:arylsulfatase [Verrucomicrobiota bacterium]
MNRIQPNLLFIICDDLAYGDLSAHGNPICRTPHLDGIARDGVSAQRHLSGPLCSPARGCLLTGRYHYRSRVVDTYCGRSIMDAAEVTLADYLRASGYRTGCFGKWHLGDTYPFRPEDRGFDETVWHLGGGIGQPGDHPGNYGRESYFDPVLCRNGQFESFEGYCTDIFSSEAMGFIRRNKERPWFAYLAFNAPHGPLQVDPVAASAMATRGATGDLPALYAMVENIDANVGRLLAALDEAGLSDNTVVVFTSDHGPCPSVRDGDGRPRFNAGLRGEKGSVYEGGVRVPCLWRGPGLPSGSLVTEPTHAIDILPTFLSLAGGAVQPDSPPLDGKNILPLLDATCPPDAWPDRPLFLQWHRGDQPTAFRNAMVVTRDRKWISVSAAGPEEIYDVANDPGETHDLAAAEPEQTARMRAAYEDWFREVSGNHRFAPVSLPLAAAGLPLRLTRQDWRVCGEDGWSPQTKARWVLAIEEAGTYEFRIQFDSAPGERGAVFLRVGDVSAVASAVADVAVYRFTVQLAAGPAELQAGWQTLYHEGSPFAVEIDR